MSDIKYSNFETISIKDSITDSVIGALIAQFSVDIFFSIFFSEDNIIIDDIREPDTSLYYAAIVSAIVVALTNKYLDRIATIILGTTFFSITNNIMSYIITDSTKYDINTIDLIFDIIASIILVYLFDPKAKYDYINHKNFRRGNPYRIPNSDRSTLDIIIIIIVLNTYSGLKDELTSYTPATTSGATSAN